MEGSRLLNIAGIFIRLDEILYTSRFASFQVSSGIPDVNVRAVQEDNVSLPQGKVLLNGVHRWLAPDNHYDLAVAWMLADWGSNVVVYAKDNWSAADIHMKRSDSFSVENAITMVGSVIFANRVLFHNGLVIHASAVKYNGQVILFCAPSGTGKSTQAGLWRELRSAETINDDTPCLQTSGSRPYVYGTPWAGSEAIFQNERAPVAAIVLLEQAPVSKIEEVALGQAVAYLLKMCNLPYYDEKMMDLATSHLAKVVSSVPVFRLHCRPDEGAVELVEQCLGL